jgi:hypothetical protein
MKRTIATSFLFLLPINMCYIYADLFHLNLSVICLGLSVANHSHNFFTHDMVRKKVINNLDKFVNGFNLFYSFYSGLTSFNCVIYGLSNVFIISYIFLRFLLPYKTEHYTQEQKTLHAVWHGIVIFSMTHYKLSCLYW